MRDQGERRRCAECRCWYTAAQSARQTQKVCGTECRKRRRRRRSRARRRGSVQECRVDERERQRKSRAERRARGAAASEPDAGASTGASHAPPLARIPLELREEILESWDRAAALSRASLKRELRVILVGSAANLGNEGGPNCAMSRTRLSVQQYVMTGECGRFVGSDVTHHPGDE